MKKTYTKPVIAKASILPRTTAAVGSPAPSPPPSDQRLKTGILRIGTTVFGLPLYQFSYIGSEERFTGVMAQDVLEVMPDAVSRDAAGFYRVDYGMLGIDMQKAA